jgi:short subunit dehydrogenase-like uncharacterized protein
MSDKNWMIYGAYGYTGRLVAEEAMRLGHKPVLAGRSAEKLVPLVERLGLESVAVDLQDKEKLGRIVGDFDLVFHAAGPFMHTSVPMVRACLDNGTNYVDVAGEVMVFEQLLALDQQARAKGIAIIPGVGFNVLATDSLARYVSEQIAHPTDLDIATYWITHSISPGSFKTMIDSFPIGTLVRRQGQLVRTSVRRGRKRIRFLDGERTVLPANMGDLAAAYATTGIPNISTFTVMPKQYATFYGWVEPLYQRLFAIASLRRLAKKWAEKTMRGSYERDHQTGRSQAWVCARNKEGNEKQAWLETMESYHFTAAAGVRSVEKVLAERPQGTLTPAVAFGADFVLEIPGTRRVDPLENEGHHENRLSIYDGRDT